MPQPTTPKVTRSEGFALRPCAVAVLTMIFGTANAAIPAAAIKRRRLSPELDGVFMYISSCSNWFGSWLAYVSLLALFGDD